ncbi:hypothetical protein G3H63_13100 [Microbacterium resistens]|uniref:hypothetical protein n=1 Tax=Microbacterium resistens TaxID=156977 RepID=UPI001C5620F5|nr:hypothetical protein [Microbacterium resistens]MBW1640002.1 hypothetical protein [Microbacterium resistens]
MSTPDPAATPRGPLWRRLLSRPLVWAALCAVVAMALHGGGGDAEFPVFLLAIVAGWLCGFAFVTATERIAPEPRGLLVHVAGAVVVGAAGLLLVSGGSERLADLPDRVYGAVLILVLGVPPAAAWILITLFARVMALVGARVKAAVGTRPAPAAPSWEGDGEGAVVRFTAVRLRIRTLALAIVGVVLVLGGGCVALLIALDDVVVRMGPRLSIVLAGLVLGLPAYLLLAASIRRRSIPCSVRFVRDRLQVRAGAETAELRLSEIELLRWRTETEYARVEVCGAGVDLSLVVGMARPPEGGAPRIPALSPRVMDLLASAGLRQEGGGRGVVTFRRTSTAPALSG